MRYLLLLPSSESKTAGGDGRWDPGLAAPRGLAAARRRVARALTSAMRDPLAAARITGIGGTAHLRAVAANRRTIGAACLPAGTRYRGVVWEHLDVTTLPADAGERARQAVIVVSALTGVARFDEPVPDYKLKMSARLDPLGGLGRFWQVPVTRSVAEWAGDTDLVVDLLPGDHARTVAVERLPVPTVQVSFTDGSGRASGHGAKAVKGRLARHLLCAGGDPRDALASFAWQGWAARPTATPALVEIHLTASPDRPPSST